MAVQFTQSAGLPLWSLVGEPPSCTIVFRPFATDGVPATLALEDSWSVHPGTHVFLPGGTALDGALATAVQQFIAAQPGPEVRLAWALPGAPWTGWSIATTAATGASPTDGAAPVALRNLALWVDGGCTIAADADALVISPPGRIALTARSGSVTLAPDGPVTIPFAGPQAGCLTFSLTLRTHQDGTPADLDQLDAALRIFGPAWTDPHPGALRSWRFPLLVPPASLPVSVGLDPLAPLDGARTAFGLAPGQQLASCYATTTGRQVALVPQQGAALVLAVRALSDPPAPADPFYLVPSGRFAIRVPDGDGGELGYPQRLMCGISGLEYATLSGPGSALAFATGGSALAPTVGAPHPSGADAGGLTGPATTAYAALLPPGGGTATYFAQPDDGPLFAPATGSFMTFHELPGTALPAAAGGLTYPLLPFAGVPAGALAGCTTVEHQAVAPARRATIGGAKVGATTATATAFAAAARPAAPAGPEDAAPGAATPQGLLMTFEEDGTALTLAQSQDGDQVLRLRAVKGALADALSSSQLFLVASDLDALKTCCTIARQDSSITIAAADDDVWTFEVFPATGWTRTLLIFKFAGKALDVLARDAATWAHATTFNGGADGVQTAQQRLIALIEEAQKSGDPEFAPFVALASDAAWNGILVLDCDVPLEDLPAQVAGIAAGIEQSDFRAHHVGVNVTPVQPGAGGAVAASDSSLFALVDYESPNDVAAAKGPYAFQVATLKVRFESSAIVTFAALLQLLVDELFGDAVAPAQAGGSKVLQLRGTYQRQGGVDAFTFATTGDSAFLSASGVVDSVDVQRAQFVTVTTYDKAKPAVMAESRFLLTGLLRFRPQAFDALSYGPTGTARASGGALAFSDLAIRLDYLPGKPAKDAYTFDASKLLPDPAQSAPRDKSLFAGFPLSPTGFVHVPAGGGGGATTPAALGFLGVTAPVGQGALSPPWFGLTATLELGTAGALAAKAGFTATLLVAWSPGAGAPNLGVGLKLPGTGGSAKLLSLQSVLKLKIGALELDSVGGTYVLRLDRIALALLGISLPPSGQVNAALFGEQGSSGQPALGWYGGYAKDASK